MRWTHPEHPGRGLRLAYCINLHPAEDLDGVRAGLERVTRPLAERLGGAGAFGVGPWLPASVAADLARDPAQAAALFPCEELDAFTYNAFPFGGFHREGLKAEVFAPGWHQPERLAFTLDVARVALAAAAPGEGHLSISTHTGGHGPAFREGELALACARELARAALALARLEEEHGRRLVLSLEPEPRSAAGDTLELVLLWRRIRTDGVEAAARAEGVAPERVAAAVARHLGTCLDACHAAVEFEAPGLAFANATHEGAPLGKLQFSSALALPAPAADARGRELLFDLHEPVYLHQVTGRGEHALVRVGDLDELRARWEQGDAALRACEEWRCHFHVPVDLDAPAGADTGGLATTRAAGDALLRTVLAAPERWGTSDLHVEIETYTWDVLPGSLRGDGELLDGLEREYRHVLALLESEGWQRAETS